MATQTQLGRFRPGPRLGLRPRVDALAARRVQPLRPWVGARSALPLVFTGRESGRCEVRAPAFACRLGWRGLLLDPGVRLDQFESARRADLSGKQFPRLQIQPPLGFRELWRGAFSGLRLMAHPVAHELRQLERTAARQLRPSLLQTLVPTVLSGFAFLMQRLLHPLHLRFAGHRAQPLTRLLDRQRHPEAVPKLEDDDFVLDAENRSLLPGCHPARPMRGIDDGIADSQLHTTRIAAQSHPAFCETYLWGQPEIRSARSAGSHVRVVLAPVRLGKVEDLAQILPAQPSFRIDAEALSGRMRLRRGRVVAGDEEAGAGLLSADRHVRELAGLFGSVHWWSATRPGRRGQAQPPRASLIVRSRTAPTEANRRCTRPGVAGAPPRVRARAAPAPGCRRRA